MPRARLRALTHACSAAAGELQRLVCECSLQSINLSGNNLGDRVVKSLCDGLR
jgi:hypothetical protein